MKKILYYIAIAFFCSCTIHKNNHLNQPFDVSWDIFYYYVDFHAIPNNSKEYCYNLYKRDSMFNFNELNTYYSIIGDKHYNSLTYEEYDSLIKYICKNYSFSNFRDWACFSINKNLDVSQLDSIIIYTNDTICLKAYNVLYYLNEWFNQKSDWKVLPTEIKLYIDRIKNLRAYNKDSVRIPISDPDSEEEGAEERKTICNIIKPASANPTDKNRAEYIIRCERNGNMSNVFSNKELPECAKNKNLVDILNTYFVHNPEISFVEFYAYE